MNNYEGYWEGLMRHNKKTKPKRKSAGSIVECGIHSDQLTSVAETLDIANEQGMAAEVMWSALTMAAEANEHGQTMDEVLAAALDEWDI